MLSRHGLCFGSTHHPGRQAAGVRSFHAEKGSSSALFRDGGIWESCLEEAAVEFSSKEYRSYFTDEVGQWPALKGLLARLWILNCVL